MLGARVALFDGDHAAADSFLKRARTYAIAELDLPRLLIRACETELRRLRDDEVVSEAELNEILALHLRSRNVGCQDEVVFSIVNCLVRRGRAREAVQLAGEYFANHRRDGFAVPSYLLGAIRGLAQGLEIRQRDHSPS